MMTQEALTVIRYFFRVFLLFSNPPKYFGSYSLKTTVHTLQFKRELVKLSSKEFWTENGSSTQCVFFLIFTENPQQIFR